MLLFFWIFYNVLCLYISLNCSCFFGMFGFVVVKMFENSDFYFLYKMLSLNFCLGELVLL